MDFIKAETVLKKKIPKFKTAETQYREIEGLTISIRRARAAVSIPGIVKLTKRFGDLLAAILSYGIPDGEESSDESPELKTLMNVDIEDADSIKDYIMMHALPQILDGIQKVAEDEFGWFIENLIPGNLTVFPDGQDSVGVSIDTMAELDELGAGAITIVHMLYFAFEVNFLPTFGGQNTSDGSARPQNQLHQDQEVAH